MSLVLVPLYMLVVHVGLRQSLARLWDYNDWMRDSRLRGTFSRCYVCRRSLPSDGQQTASGNWTGVMILWGAE